MSWDPRHNYDVLQRNRCSESLNDFPKEAHQTGNKQEKVSR